MTDAPSSLFVTSTGTEIGKTVVSTLFVRLLKSSGRATGYFKPIASGCGETEHGYRSPDEVEVIRGSSLAPKQVHAEYRFDAPLSPDRAARRQDRSIELAPVMKRWGRLRDRYDSVVVEGIGGVAVPFTPGRDPVDVADLAARLELPTVLVVAAGLGTISHTRTAVSYLERAGVRTAGIVLTPARGEDIETVNRDHLRELYPERPVELLPECDPEADRSGDARAVGENILGTLGLIQ